MKKYIIAAMLISTSAMAQVETGHPNVKYQDLMLETKRDVNWLHTYKHGFTVMHDKLGPRDKDTDLVGLSIRGHLEITLFMDGGMTVVRLLPETNTMITETTFDPPRTDISKTMKCYVFDDRMNCRVDFENGNIFEVAGMK